jgi:hypothetical protein
LDFDSLGFEFPSSGFGISFPSLLIAFPWPISARGAGASRTLAAILR